jgi:hypothetical protein
MRTRSIQRRRCRGGRLAIGSVLVAISLGSVAAGSSAAAMPHRKTAPAVITPSYDAFVAEAAERDPRAMSPAGAMGLMQIMPDTWATERARLRLGNDPFDMRDNILAGTDFLRAMRARYGAIGMLAAYNAGPGRYEDYYRRGRPLPAETLAYLGRLAPVVTGSAITDDPTPARPDPLAWTRAALFAPRSGSISDPSAAVATPPPARSMDADAAEPAMSSMRADDSQTAGGAPRNDLFVALTGARS